MTIKVTLPNGAVVEGERNEMADLLEQLEHTKKGVAYYYSSSHGRLLEINKMDTVHIKNALLKIYREFVSGLSSETDPQKLTKMIFEGPADLDFVNLFRELRNRRS